MKTEQEIQEALHALSQLFDAIPKRRSGEYFRQTNTISLVLEQYKRDVREAEVVNAALKVVATLDYANVWNNNPATP